MNIDICKNQIKREFDKLRDLDISDENINQKLLEVYSEEELQHIHLSVSLLTFFLEGNFSEI